LNWFISRNAALAQSLINKAALTGIIKKTIFTGSIFEMIMQVSINCMQDKGEATGFEISDGMMTG
jgi:hypothetical protein